MSQYLEAFLLGNGAILTNVCLLPLYPGLIAFLGNRVGGAAPARHERWLGALVLAGILTMMLLVGFILYIAQAAFGSVLPVILPILYGAVILLGILMLLDRSPFRTMTTLQAPVLKNPYLTAYVYGLLLGPMTLPCTGPLITSAFLLGAGDAAQLVDGLAYFLAFGLGFGWPLVLLPFVAMSLQRHFTGWLTRNHSILTRASGVLLVLIGVFGIWVEVLPNM
jgi:cytochrome c-type biogenesis protein